MKIGLVRRGYSASGGAEAYLTRLAAGLRQHGDSVTLYTTTDWPADRWTGGDLIRIIDSAPLGFARGFARVRRKEEIILSLDRVPGCDVYRSGDGVHAAWLQRRRKFEPGWKGWLRQFRPKHAALLALERQVFQSAKAVIANSRMVADEIRHWHNFPAARIHVVPNGIGAAIPRIPCAEARARLDLPAEAFIVLFVGTGWERKGLRFALEAVEQLNDALLVVAGRGSARRSASARFLGPVHDLSALFSAADVFTLPTIYDPFSNACLEALAAGLPVITTTANGFSEILTPGVQGDVVEPGDSRALAAALEHWRPRDREETAAACQALAAQFSIERNVNETLRVLREAAA